MRHSSVKTHTLPERGERFAHWLGRRFFQETHKTQNPETLKSSLVNFETQARFEGHAQPVFLRVGSVDEKIYINLCNKNWKYVEIGLNDWKVIDNPPVRFRLVAGMLRSASDTLCRLSTGRFHVAREFFTNQKGIGPSSAEFL